MRTAEVVDFVGSLGCALPNVERFWQLGDRTGLRQNGAGRFYRANYERGILLYALVGKYRPAAVLEFGTGRGYGCLCMAWAMEDYDIPGRIYSIDVVGQDETIAWPIDWGSGPRVEQLSRRHVWSKAAPAAWTDRVVTLTGYAGQMMARWSGPRVDLAFVDAGHGLEAVRHDYYSVLDVAADRFGILFDDYSPQPGFGVQEVIDGDVARCFDATLVYTDRRWPGGERAAVEDPEYGMVWVHTDGARSDRLPGRLTAEQRGCLQRYRRRESVTTLRHRLGRLARKLGVR